MTSRLTAVTATILLTVTLCGLAQSADPGKPQQTPSGDGALPEGRYQQVVDLLLPGGDTRPDEFPSSARWVTTVRIAPSREEPEYGFSLVKLSDGRIEASVYTPKNGSILKQLEQLGGRVATASAEEISESIGMQRQHLVSQTCPQLKQLAAKFEAIRMSPNVEDDLRMDETGYIIWSQTRWGNSLKVSLGGLGPNAPRQPHPLPEWVELFRRTVKACPPTTK